MHKFCLELLPGAVSLTKSGSNLQTCKVNLSVYSFHFYRNSSAGTPGLPEQSLLLYNLTPIGGALGPQGGMGQMPKYCSQATWVLAQNAITQVAPAGQAVRVMIWLGLESWSDKAHWAGG